MGRDQHGSCGVGNRPTEWVNDRMLRARRFISHATPVLLLAVLAAPASAGADELAVRDSKVRSVWAADGVVLYSRAGNSARRPLERQWMRVVDGKAKRARGVPRGASPYEMTNVSRDAAGRAVVPFLARRRSGVRRWTTRWWSYDLRSDRARPMSHIPSMTCIGTRWVSKSCDVCVNAVASWGRSRAWSKCLDGGVFLRRHGRTIRVADREASQLALRGGTLVGEVEGRQSTGVLALLAVGGKRWQAAPLSLLPRSDSAPPASGRLPRRIKSTRARALLARSIGGAPGPPPPPAISP